MTIPTRPAPLPPIPSSSSNTRKEAPPRPPPPKIKPESNKSVGILSNLFSNKNGIDKSRYASENLPSPKIPAPPSAAKKPVERSLVDCFKIELMESALISFDETPLPTFMKSKTGSDSVSIESSNSAISSPSNSGATSQAESGFDDDFYVTSSNPFECLDYFEHPKGSGKAESFSNIRSIKPPIHPKPISESSSVYISTSLANDPVEDFGTNESRGKNFIRPAKNSMPTIIKIKPMVPNKGKAPLETHSDVCNVRQSNEDMSDMFSLPMPTIPPPQLPSLDSPEEETSSFAIALYNFESDIIEDLNFKVNEKVYLIRQIDDEWFFGRNKRGCEGIFPISYVDIKAPLKVELDSVSPAGFRVRARYTFIAEAYEDLTIKENEMVNVLSQINIDWLFGVNESGNRGQFPANFLEYVPSNLPQTPTK